MGGYSYLQLLLLGILILTCVAGLIALFRMFFGRGLSPRVIDRGVVEAMSEATAHERLLTQRTLYNARAMGMCMKCGKYKPGQLVKTGASITPESRPSWRFAPPEDLEEASNWYSVLVCRSCNQEASR